MTNYFNLNIKKWNFCFRVCWSLGFHLLVAFTCTNDSKYCRPTGQEGIKIWASSRSVEIYGKARDFKTCQKVTQWIIDKNNVQKLSKMNVYLPEIRVEQINQRTVKQKWANRQAKIGKASSKVGQTIQQGWANRPARLIEKKFGRTEGWGKDLETPSFLPFQKLDHIFKLRLN